jgi:hypothetical protein
MSTSANFIDASPWNQMAGALLNYQLNPLQVKLLTSQYHVPNELNQQVHYFQMDEISQPRN